MISYIKKGLKNLTKKIFKVDWIALLQRIANLIIAAVTAFEKIKPHLPLLKDVGKVFISLLIGFFHYHDF
jgi:hypothetical protein